MADFRPRETKIRFKIRKFNPLTPRAFCQKCILWTFWRFLAWIWAKLAPWIYSKRHLQHDSRPWLHWHCVLQHFSSGMHRNQTLEINFNINLFLFTFPLPPFVIILQQWSTFYWACFQFKNVWESIFGMGNFTMELLSVVNSNFWAFLCISQAPVRWSLIWVHVLLERSFLPAELSIDNAN